MDTHQPSFIVEGTPLAPTVHIVLPPELQEDAKALAAENVHPAWSKAQHRGRHFVITTNILDDLSELATTPAWALKSQSLAFQNGSARLCKSCWIVLIGM